MRSDLAEIRVEFLRSLCSALNLINFRLFDCLTGAPLALLSCLICSCSTAVKKCTVEFSLERVFI